MIHKVIPVGLLQCNCSILGDEATHEAMVVDPGDDIERVLAIVNENGLTVKQIVVTHAHIDHVGGAMRLKKLTGAPILLNQSDTTLLKMLDTQAAWLGMQPPDEVKIDQDLADGDVHRPRRARRLGQRLDRGGGLPVARGAQRLGQRVALGHEPLEREAVERVGAVVHRFRAAYACTRPAMRTTT
jgi:glyoxylase-like metal-dependent hydrolase (beta-lactamase superfamily II)